MRLPLSSLLFVLATGYSIVSSVYNSSNLLSFPTFLSSYEQQQQQQQQQQEELGTRRPPVEQKKTPPAVVVVDTNSPSNLPLPLQILREYKKHHSVTALLNEEEQEQAPHNHHNNNRTFVIGWYSCPQLAGNRIHHFTNALLWAVLTNRTLLWRYYNYKRTGIHNTVEDCDEILKRAEWIPSYDEWSDRWNLSNSDVVKLSKWTNYVPAEFETRTWTEDDWKHAKRQTGLDARHDVVIVDLEKMEHPLTEAFQNTTVRDHFLHTDEARQRATALYSLDWPFLYGMLFRESFQFQPHLFLNHDNNNHDNNNNNNQRTDNHKNDISIVLHSRHPDNTDGSNIDKEMECLDRMLEVLHSQKPTATRCTVYLMSDRQATLSALQNKLVSNDGYNCHAVMANHSQGTFSLVENGPFAGLGFYQDWAMVTSSSVPSHDGLIGSYFSTASDLILELLEYDRAMKAWQQQQQQDQERRNQYHHDHEDDDYKGKPLEPLLNCFLPRPETRPGKMWKRVVVSTTTPGSSSSSSSVGWNLERWQIGARFLYDSPLLKY